MRWNFIAGLPHQAAAFALRTGLVLESSVHQTAVLSLTKLQGSFGVKLPQALLQEAFLKPC